MNLKRHLAHVILAVGSLAVGTAFAAPLEIAGSTTVHKSIVEPVSAKAKDAGVEIKMLPVGSGKGVAMLLEGKVTVAAISEELPDAVNAAKKAGAPAAPANLKVFVASTDKLEPIVNPENKVATLTKDQVKSILTGKISNWKEVGGADMPIVVIIPAVGSGTRGVIEKMVLGGGEFAASSKEMRTSSAEVAEVAREKGAIGYVGSGVAESAKGKVREVPGSEVSRSLSFVTVGEPSPEVKKLYDFLQTAEAKKLFLQ